MLTVEPLPAQAGFPLGTPPRPSLSLLGGQEASPEEAPGGRQNPGAGGLGPSVWKPRVPFMPILLILGPECVAQ